MAEHDLSVEDFNSKVCENRDGTAEFRGPGQGAVQSLEAVESDAIFKFLSVCLRQFSDYRSEVKRGRGAADGNEADSKVTSKECNVKSVASELQLDKIVQEMKREKIANVCRYCRRDFDQDFQEHLETCLRFPVCCSMCSKVTVPRDQLTDHINQECTMNSAPCVYQDIGCPFQGTESSMAKHIERSTEEHLRQAYHAIQEQRVEMQLHRERAKKQEQAIWQLTESVGKLKALCDETVKEKEQQNKIMNRMSEHLREQKKHQSKFEKEMKHKLEKIENHSDDLFRFPGLNGYGEMVWRISNYTRRLQRVQTGRSEDPVTSEPFYTSAYGYKAAIWVYINGRGREEGQGISVYCCMMSSEYDAVLKWPIKPKYTFILLDQNEDFERRTDLVRTRKVHDFKRDDGRPKGIERPTHDERAIIVGFDDFITHEELEAGHFLADDCMFIRVLVDMS